MLSRFAEHTRCAADLFDALPGAVGRAFGRPDEVGSSRAAVPARGTPGAARDHVQQLLGRIAERRAPMAGLDDIDGTVETLRLERYLDNSITQSEQHGAKAVVRKAYYGLRPLLPVSLRKHLQRAALRGWDSIPFPRWPVDTSIEELFDAAWRVLLDATGRDELPFVWYWPDGHSSACIMTHDVETQVGRDFCGELMRMERLVGIASAFEVVPEERYPVPESYLQEIRDNGCEVAVHGLNHDGRLFTSPEIFFSRAEKINEYARQWGARGFRSPVMYRNLDWIGALKFSYDMSVPNVGHLDPQRGGCCTVLPYFIGDLVELPLTTIQDYSLFNIVRSRSLDLWKTQIDTIRARHGLISFIVHPDYVNQAWSSGVYARLLDHIAELRADHDVWVTLPRDVDAWWRARNEMYLVRVDGTWTISGPQAERASVAYARLESGKVLYRVEPPRNRPRSEAGSERR